MATAAFASSREALFRAVFELSRDAIFVLDRSGYLDCNQAGLDLFGLANDQALRALKIGDASPFLQPDGRNSRTAAQEYVEAAFSKGRQFFEWQGRRMDGSLFFTEVSLNRIEISGEQYLHATLHDITERKRAEQMLALQYAVTEIITSAKAFDPAIEAILRTLCEALDFSIGALWLPALAGDHMCCANIWHDPGVPMNEFLAVTASIRFSRGNSLPGQVWADGAPRWIPVEPDNPNYPRARSAANAGFQTGMGFPLRIGDTVDGVIDFFSREVRQPDDALRSALARIGEQIAQFQRQKQAERRLLDLNAELEARVVARTQELQRHRETLESTIAQRTAELRENNVRLQAEVIERRRSEDELRKLSWAVENSPTMVIITDALGRIEYVNPRFVQVTGYAEKEVMGRSPKLLKSNTHPTDFYAALWQTIGAGKTWRGDFLNKRKNGELYWQASTISPIRNANGMITHFVAVMEDVTERKRIAEEMQRAKVAAETTSRAKSEFLANISHEIRTPMNAIIGLNHLLKTTKLNGRQRNFVVNIETAAQHLMEIICDILDFSKIESGKVNLQHIEFTLEAVMSKLAQVMAVQAQQKSLEFTITVAPEIPAVLIGDPLRLGQVLLNLTSNAIKFTKEGRVGVSAELVRIEDKVAEIRFTVSDTGIGVAEKLRAKLFAPFEQADMSATRRYGGAGLGLVISKRFVELMNGAIDVRSKPGAGTTVVFTVRIADAEKRASQIQPQLPPMEGRRALVADENEASREALQALLNGFSFDVVCVFTGAGLIQELRRGSEAGTQGYDLIFLSESLSDANWRDALERIRALDGAAKQMAVVLVTAQDSDALRASADDAQLKGFLLKPFTRSTLYDVMMHALSSSAQGGDAAPANEMEATAARQVLRGTRILLVEDNEINQLVASELLSLGGSVVTVANSGAECLRKLAEPNSHLSYDLVLMDVQMPEMDGIEATRRIRQDPRLTRIPVIAMTADVVQGVKERCLAAGMNDYLSKPIQPDELYGKVALWIQVAKLPPQERGSRRPTGAQKVQSHSSAVSKSGKHAALSKASTYIDANAGIARVAGNVTLYERLLRQFHEKYAHADDDIDSLLTHDRREDAVRIAHTVKGVAGNLGVTALHKAAIEWERCLKDGQESDKAADSRFRTMLHESMVAITKLLPAQAKKHSTPIPTASRASAGAISQNTKATILRLAATLESNDLDAAALAKSLAEQLQGHGVESELAAIQENIQRFDFVSSLSILKRIMNRLDISM